MRHNTSTNVQLRRRPKAERFRIDVADTLEITDDEPVIRITLDIRVRDDEFLAKFAEYRNAVARASTKQLVGRTVRVKRQWSRKSIAEATLAARCDAIKRELKPLFDALGPLPEPDDVEALDRYAKRALALEKKASE